MILTVSEGLIETDVYANPTDRHLYFLYTSLHFLQVIPYVVAIRLKRNCSSDEVIQAISAEYKHYHKN